LVDRFSLYYLLVHTEQNL